MVFGQSVAVYRDNRGNQRIQRVSSRTGRETNVNIPRGGGRFRRTTALETAKSDRSRINYSINQRINRRIKALRKQLQTGSSVTLQEFANKQSVLPSNEKTSISPFADTVIPSFPKSWDEMKVKLGFDAENYEGPTLPLLTPLTMVKGGAGKSLQQMVNAHYKNSGVGTTGLNPKAKGLGKRFAQNSKNLKSTMKWVAGIASTIGLSMGAIALYKDVIGTRVFTGWMGQEAAAQMNFGFNRAAEMNDLEGMRAANEMQKEVIELMQTGAYKEGLPYDDAIKAADKFIEGSSIMAQINDRYIADMEIKISNGETDEQMWDRINADKVAAEKAMIDYYNEQRIITEREILRLRAKADEDSTRLWEDYKSRLAAQEKADAEASALMWLEYQKLMQKRQENNAPSQLNFGI